MKNSYKYSVDLLYNWHGSYNAGSKARKDVSRTLEGLGYKIADIRNKEYKSRRFTALIRKLQIIWLYYFRLINAKIVLFQYPGVTSLWLLKKLKKKGCKIIILVHDIESIREERSFNEKELLDYADTIISHTKNMSEQFVCNGINRTIYEIYLFDYYIKDKTVYNEEDLNSIAFCGNLGKSPFIYELDKCKWDIPTYLYGIDCNKKFTNSFIKYMGKFESEEISSLKGAWGLVWDGISIESCNSTPIGRYLKFNSSHKASLYIVAEKPLIVWKESALAEFVIQKGIGIVINSLDEISKKISNFNQEEYNALVRNVIKIKNRLINGDILKMTISRIEKTF